MWKAILLVLGAGLVVASENLEDSRSLWKASRGSGIYIGTAINYWDLQSDNTYRQMAVQQYNLVTAESGCKMKPIWKSYTEYDFTMCDYVISFAESHSMAVRGHNLIWATNQFLPDFVKAETSAWKLEKYMIQYIKKVVSHVGEKAFAWDVVNEAVSDNKNELIKQSPWSKIDDYLCKGFKAAHEANPKALLFYNDYSIASATGWSKAKSDKVFNMLKEMRARGCPVNGVGIQAHLTIDFSQEMIEGVRQNIQRYGAERMDVHITELDIECSARKACTESDWTYEMRQTQANIYSNLLKICLEERACRSFETWGFTDKYSWLAQGQDALPFDKWLKPKLVYDRMYETLASRSWENQEETE